MNTWLTTIETMLVPLTIFLAPGLAVIWYRQRHPLLISAGLMVVWSLTVMTVSTLIATALHIPVTVPWVIVLGVTLFLIWPAWRTHFLHDHQLHQQWLTLAALCTLVFALFALPFFLIHQGLPTGDSQKGILWATYINQHVHLPDYQTAIDQLNRDPVDFVTPGLHSLTALLLQVSAQPLTAIGLFAIGLAIATNLVAIAIGRLVFPSIPRLPLAFWTTLLFLTQVRYLRYLREPGYHWQNQVGEFFLFGTVLVTLLLLRSWVHNQKFERTDWLLLFLTLISLAVSHQFSAFLAAFLALPLLLIGLLALHQHRQHVDIYIWIVLGAVAIVAGITAWLVNLPAKLPHLFTTTPHLLNLTPGLADYPQLMGVGWLLLGITGLLLLLIELPADIRRHPEQAAFTLVTITLLLLSQGPRFGIDIPPVRTLFYSVLPLSLTGAYAITLVQKQLNRVSAATRYAVWLALGAVVAVTCIPSLTTAYQLSHTLRTNSTLTAKQLILVTYLYGDQHSGAVLVDDFNRRGSSWLALSGRPMYTRIASDIHQHMAEAGQSELRYQLYLRQLDFEKIFSLGSLPLSGELLDRQNIAYVTGISGSSHLGLAANEGLRLTETSGDITLFKQTLTNTGACLAGLKPEDYSWLLRAATLVNDIGDPEDTFEHLPASIRSPRLSDPITAESCTKRTTTANAIPLRFNVGDYVQILWDADGLGTPDTALEALIITNETPNGLTLSTNTGVILPFAHNTAMRLRPDQVTIESDGFITLTINNPEGHVVGIDSIALGLARIP